MEDLNKLAEKLVVNAKTKEIIIAVAESCTGGLVSSAITGVSGASQIFDRGFITYSYESKKELLGVSTNTLETYGAVSIECVEEMALGAIKSSLAQISVAISGIAGPAGGMADKPVGLVYFAYYDKKSNKIRSEKQQFAGDRTQIRIASAIRALELLSRMVNEY